MSVVQNVDNREVEDSTGTGSRGTHLSMHTDFYSDFLAFPHALISLITNSC